MFAFPRPCASAALARFLAAALVAVTTLGARADSSEAVVWHPDLESALAASQASQKPVLAVFTARWSEAGAAIEQRCLASAEAGALVAACFEPVLVDVDEHPDVTRQLAVTRVPSASVISADRRVLSSFMMPDTPADFVAAAARGLHEAAQVLAADAPGANLARGDASRGDASRGELAPDAFGAAQDSVALSVDDGAADRTASTVTAKVRRLSSFANADGTPAADASAAIAQAAPGGPAFAGAVAVPPVQPTPQRPTPAPTAGPWPAEQRTASFDQEMPRGPTVATAIDPAPATAAPTWLGSGVAGSGNTVPGATVPVPPVQERESSVTIVDAPPSAGQSFWAALTKPFSFFSRRAPADEAPVVPPAAVPPTLPPARPQPPAGLAGLVAPAPATAPAASPPAAEDLYGSMPLGLEGYCPVTLADRGAWAEGRAQWGARHRGRTYLFAGPDEQRSFLANPDRYAPALSGDDPVVAFESGRALPGRRTFGVTYQSRMYLFSSAETRAAFSADPERYTTKVLLAERPALPEATRLY